MTEWRDPPKLRTRWDDEVEICSGFESLKYQVTEAIITRSDLHDWLHGDWTTRRIMLGLYEELRGPIRYSGTTEADAAHVLLVLEQAFEQRRLVAVRTREARRTAPAPATDEPAVPRKPPTKVPTQKTWISIQMVDEKKEPVPGLAFEIANASGVVASGTLDEHGSAFVEGIVAGTCKVRFPELDACEWA